MSCSPVLPSSSEDDLDGTTATALPLSSSSTDITARGRLETTVLRDVVIRYVKCVNDLEDLKNGLENEIANYFEKSFEQFR